VPQIEVTFDIDANGILHVSAQDKATGKEQSIRIESSSGLNDSEVDQMVRDAESHAAEDKGRREKVDARNNADSLLYTARKSLSDLGDKVDPSDKAEVESAISDLEAVLETADVEVLRQKTEALQSAAAKVAQKAYEAGAAGQAGAEAAGATDEETAGGPGGQESADGPVEAEYEVVDDDKK
jgi:molecular chaperone DnaK